MRSRRIMMFFFLLFFFSSSFFFIIREYGYQRGHTACRRESHLSTRLPFAVLALGILNFMGLILVCLSLSPSFSFYFVLRSHNSNHVSIFFQSFYLFIYRLLW